MLGQNFLVDKKAGLLFVKALGLKSTDTVLEVGPGLGSLTVELAKGSKAVIAVERDRSMIDILKDTLKGCNNVKVIHGDILEAKVDLKDKKVAGNLPFYLTAHVIRKLLESEPKPKNMVFMVQKEVGQRICETPPRMTLLAVSVQIYAEAKIISKISKNSFWPVPKVDSVIIKITPKQEELEVNRDAFFKIVKAGFLQPRKQLINNLSRGLEIKKDKIETWLKGNKIDPTRRAETLSVKDWLNLTKTLK